MLGGLKVARPEASITRFRTQKTGALLAYLAYYAGRTHSREVLIEALWPDDDRDAARHKLSVALSWIRKHLEPLGVPDSSVLVADRFSLRLNAEAVRTDVAEFEAGLEAARCRGVAAEETDILRATLQLYRGPLLPGYYEEWILPEQRRLEALYFEAVRRLVPLLEQAGDQAGALQCALGAVAVDPLREEFQRLVIRLYAETRQPEAALRQYEELRVLLQEEVGSSPSEETRNIILGVRQLLGGREKPQRVGPSLVKVAFAEPRLPADSVLDAPCDDSDPIGGAVPLESRFYLERDVDGVMERALHQRTSVVLIKGARQVGKTSLLARGLQHARKSGARAVYTDLKLFNAEQLRSVDVFLQAVARSMAEQLGLPFRSTSTWDPEDGPSMNFRRFIRTVMQEDSIPALVWALDDVDRLFSYPFGDEVFAMMRAWHNERALDPDGPWSRLTLAIAYATEAHLLISDVNQSPFNVGTRLLLEDFSYQQVTRLNFRYGGPLRDSAEVRGFWDLTGGHPYLVRRGLLEMSAAGLSYAVLDARADHDDWVYGDHLRRLRTSLLQDRELCGVVRQLLEGHGCRDAGSFHRLRSAGVLTGDIFTEARLRCRLYSRYLSRHLPLQP